MTDTIDRQDPSDSDAPAHLPLSSSELSRITKLLEAIRATLSRLPADSVAEVTSLLATVDGHLGADPPNAVATREAFALIRDQLATHHSRQSSGYDAELDRVLKMLGQTE